HAYMDDAAILVVEEDQITRFAEIEEFDGVALHGLLGSIAWKVDAHQDEEHLRKSTTIHPAWCASTPEVGSTHEGVQVEFEQIRTFQIRFVVGHRTNRNPSVLPEDGALFIERHHGTVG